MQEVALIGMLGYLSYLCGEFSGLSGIVTLFCCAVAISHYALHNISAPARVTLVRSCQTLSYVSEGAIFIYVGMDTLDPLKWKVGALASANLAILKSGAGIYVSVHMAGPRTWKSRFTRSQKAPAIAITSGFLA